MITGTLIALSLALGYLIAVGLSLAITFAITAARPHWVTKKERLTREYKFINALVWLACVTAGAYITASIAGATHAWFVGVVLAVILTGVSWANSWETQQRGLAHQAFVSLLALAGVGAGYVLRLK